jgi:hypothetical protein
MRYRKTNGSSAPMLCQRAGGLRDKCLNTRLFFSKEDAGKNLKRGDRTTTIADTEATNQSDYFQPNTNTPADSILGARQWEQRKVFSAQLWAAFRLFGITTPFHP